MPISFSCEFCRKAYCVDDTLAGKRVRCPDCGHVFHIPARTVLTAAELEDPFGLTEAAPPRPSSRSASADLSGAAEPPPYWPAAQDDEFFQTPPRFPKTPTAKPQRHFGASGSVMPQVAGVTFLAALLLLAVTRAAVAAGSPSAAAVGLVLTIVVAVIYLVVVGIWQLVLPFQESLACGLMFLFVPFYALYYTITRWETMKGPFLAGCGSILILVGLSVMGPLLNQRLPRNAPVVAVAPPAAAAPVNPFGAPPMPPAPGGFGPGFIAAERFRQFHQEVRQFHQEMAKPFGVPPMLPGPREFGPGFNPFDHFLELPQRMHQLTQQRQQEIVTKYGDRALTITVTGLPPGDSEASAFVLDQIKAALGETAELSSTSSNGVLVLVAGPIHEPDEVAAKLTFGRIDHPSRGVINVAADAERIPKAPDIPADADRITRTLAELQLHDRSRRREAIRRLVRQPVDRKRQAEVARALEGQLQERDVFTRQEAIKALATWGDSDSVPALIAMLTHDDVFTRQGAIKALASLRDGRAIEPITERLVEVADRMAAMEALRAFGEAAEPAVLKLLEHPDVFVRSDACKVLKAVGTQASITALRQVVRAGGFPAIAAREALQGIGSDR